MACGTIRANRVPLEVRNSKPATGEQRAYCSRPLLCLKFRDKKYFLCCPVSTVNLWKTCVALEEDRQKARMHN